MADTHILAARISVIFSLLFFTLSMVTGHAAFGFATAFAIVLTLWFTAMGVSYLVADKQINAEAAV